jgi:hypothetical protein
MDWMFLGLYDDVLVNKEVNWRLMKWMIIIVVRARIWWVAVIVCLGR